MVFNSSVMRSYSNFIGGEWVAARTGQNYQNFNPADTREFVAQYPRSGKAEAGQAVQAAQKAWPPWAAMTPVVRGRILGKASQILETRKAELAEMLTREEGKTLAESAGEVQRAIDIFRFFSGLSYTLGGQTLPHDLPGNLLFTVRQPLGVVGLITPWNFPIAIPAWKMAPAQMEMGGKNPTIVLADADLDLAASLVTRAGFGLTGQACTATSRVIVERPVLEPFVEKLAAK